MLLAARLVNVNSLSFCSCLILALAPPLTNILSITEDTVKLAIRSDYKVSRHACVKSQRIKVHLAEVHYMTILCMCCLTSVTLSVSRLSTMWWCCLGFLTSM